MQIVPVQPGDGDVATDVLTIDEAALRAVPNPWERARLADRVAAQLQQRSLIALDIRRDAVRELVVQGAAQNRVARFLGLTPTRISQLVGVAKRSKQTHGEGVA